MTSLVESTKKNSLSSSLSKLMPEPVANSNTPSQVLDTSTIAETGSSIGNFFTNITWQTWLIIILILAFFGINIFAYLAKTTTGVSEFINKYFGPILKLFGFSALETTKQTINTSATGTKASVDFVADTTTGAIDTVENAAKNNSMSTTTTTTNTSTTNTSTTNMNKNPNAQKASSSQKNSMPVQQQIQEAGSAYEWNQGSLDSALNDAAKQPEPEPNESMNYTTGKAGWCFIGDDRNTRSCAKIGVNDMCMSGDIFPTQEVCMNPNLRV